MDNPGLKKHSSEPKLEVVMRRKANRMAVPHTMNNGPYDDSVSQLGMTTRQNLTTPPAPTGVGTPQPVSATNGAEPILANRPMEANPNANQARLDRQKMPGGGSSAENPAWTRAHMNVQEKMQQRRAHPLHQAAKGWDEGMHGDDDMLQFEHEFGGQPDPHAEPNMHVNTPWYEPDVHVPPIRHVDPRSPQYDSDYERGWNASHEYGENGQHYHEDPDEWGPSPLERLDDSNASHAAYDGYMDDATGRRKYHLRAWRRLGEPGQGPEDLPDEHWDHPEHVASVKQANIKDLPLLGEEDWPAGEERELHPAIVKSPYHMHGDWYRIHDRDFVEPTDDPDYLSGHSSHGLLMGLKPGGEAGESEEVDHHSLLGQPVDPGYSDELDQISPYPEWMRKKSRHPLHQAARIPVPGRGALNDLGLDTFHETGFIPPESAGSNRQPMFNVKKIHDGSEDSWDSPGSHLPSINSCETCYLLTGDRLSQKGGHDEEAFGYVGHPFKPFRMERNERFSLNKRAETDEEFWARMDRENPGEQPSGHSPVNAGDAAGQHFDDEGNHRDPYDPDVDDEIPENMSFRDHAKLLKRTVVTLPGGAEFHVPDWEWDGKMRYPSYTHNVSRHVALADGTTGTSHEGHVIEHNSHNTGPALPTEDHEPHILEYPWSHSYYPAGHPEEHGLAKGYNTLDRALEAANKLKIWGPHHPNSAGVLDGYSRIGDDAPYHPSMIEQDYGKTGYQRDSGK